MAYYSPQLIHTMRAVLDAVMTQVPMSHATPGFKAHLAEVILQAAAQGVTTGSRGIGPDSNNYLDAHLIKKCNAELLTRPRMGVR